MTVKSLLKSALIALMFSNTAVAESNLAGIELTVNNDYSASSEAYDGPSLDESSADTPDPALSYLPDPSPLEEYAPEKQASNVTADDLWQRIKDGYAMPEINSQYTRNHEEWYASRPDYVKRMVDRSQKYLYHVVEEVQKRGMPTEIALLPMVESAFNPQAYSRSRASGIWQFVPSTGKDFGLKQTWWVDNRRDVTAATDAALTYLQKLHVMFGTWDLALAAYNAGEGTVRRAIERNQKQGLPTDYENLSLPPETKNYVPKLQAIKNIMTNPEQFGLKIKTIPNRPYFTKVIAPQKIDAQLAAKLAEVPFEEFSALNPEYNRPVLTASGSVHDILLPVSAAETFKNNLANYDKPLVNWQTYHAKRGERMDHIARKFGIDIAQLRDVNDLPSRKKLRNAAPLLVPSKRGAVSASAVSVISADDTNSQYDETANTQSSGENNNLAQEQNAENLNTKHLVKRGETIYSIARRYNTTPKQLVAINHIRNNQLRTGQMLAVNTASSKSTILKPSKAESKIATRSRNKKTHYVVKRGDTLDSIARKFDIARDDLQRWNNMTGSHIEPGLKLTVIKQKEA